jgi:sialate O-acetylesterase
MLRRWCSTQQVACSSTEKIPQSSNGHTWASSSTRESAERTPTFTDFSLGCCLRRRIREKALILRYAWLLAGSIVENQMVATLRSSLWIIVQISTAALSLSTNFCWADVRLPKLIGNNMVLQRDAKVTLWGWADPNENVRIEFHDRHVTVRADTYGRWLTSLGVFPAGGPYDMTIQGKNRISFHNILIGDIWVASGQSNMEFRLKAKGGWMTGVNNADRELQGAHYPEIRLLTIEHTAALRPLADAYSDGWRAVTPETAGDFSAVAYLFARELHQRYKVPIGLIESDKGNTRVEAWMSAAALSSFSDFRSATDAIAHLDEPTRIAYEHYRTRWTHWYEEHGNEDRGRVDGRDIWVDPNLDVSQWATIEEPRPNDAWGKDFGGFDGVVWFRRSIALLPEEEQKDLHLHLGAKMSGDVTYFNGQKVGEPPGDNARDYTIPGKYVRRGQNIIVVRLVGQHDPSDPSASGVGMFDADDTMYIETDTRTLPLAGTWSYMPGPDLWDYPVATPQIASVRPSSKTPTALFNAMISPLVHFRIKGAIWYQGEGNTDRPQQYRYLFPALIKDWRRQWGYQFPFLFVQIAGFGPEQPESSECKWAELREAQTVALALPSVGMATAVDIGDADNVHPRNKQDVAHRLVLAAAKIAYGENIISSGPTYRSMHVEGNSIRIRFSNLGGGLWVRDKYGYVRGFELAGKDSQFSWARAQLDGSDILVSAEAVTRPVAVRYDWSNTPDGNVFNKEGLPAIPFGTAAPNP